MSFTHLDLFAGIGGFSRAVEWLGGRTVAFVEWEAWNRRVLYKHWPEARFYGDIRTVTAGDISGLGRIDLITGGYPCQPFSHAGKRLGTEDDRHLWPEMRRVIDIARPRYVLAENVAGHINMGLDLVLSELEADGYTAGAVVVPAAAVNALHRRDRVWILAHRNDVDRNGRHARGEGEHTTGAVAYTRNHGPQTELQPVCNRSAYTAVGNGGSFADAAVADAATRGLRRGRAPGHDGQPALGGEGDASSDANRGRLIQREECHLEPAQSGLKASPRNNAIGHGASLPGAGVEVARSVDPRPDGISARLVRRPAARSPWDDPDVIRAMWADGSWEADLPRVVSDEPERRQKLQAAGNAIVSVVAYEILRVMLADAD